MELIKRAKEAFNNARASVSDKALALTVGGVGLVAADGAFAADAATDVPAAIAAAVDAAKSNFTVVVVGVITVAAIGFAVGLIVSHLRK